MYGSSSDPIDFIIIIELPHHMHADFALQSANCRSRPTKIQAYVLRAQRHEDCSKLILQDAEQFGYHDGLYSRREAGYATCQPR